MPSIPPPVCNVGSNLIASKIHGAISTPAAEQTIKNVKNADAVTSYLHAILCARQGNNSEASSYLKEALQKDNSLAAYADKDLEFAKINK